MRRRAGWLLRGGALSVLAALLVVTLVDVTLKTRPETATDGGARVEALDFAFAPRIVAASGTTLDVEVANEGLVEHTFTVPDAGVDVVLAPGATAEVSLQVAGELRFICRYHHVQGMRGVIATDESAA